MTKSKSVQELVKELRERTGAGIVDCMEALKASNNNIDKAIIWLQEKGKAKAAKKSGVVATEGVVGVVATPKKLVLYEVSSQTDFVAVNDLFQSFVNKIEVAFAHHDFKDLAGANHATFQQKTVADLCVEATSVIGEKIELRRVDVVNLHPGEVVGFYVHVNKRIAAALVTKGGDAATAKNVSMHIASMNPHYLNEASVPHAVVEKLKKEVDSEIAASPQNASKPVAVRENIAKGMLRKRLAELTLVDQEFVMEKMLVSQYLANHKAAPISMHRFEVGEGVEKKTVNFADEVKAQMKQAKH